MNFSYFTDTIKAASKPKVYCFHNNYISCNTYMYVIPPRTFHFKILLMLNDLLQFNTHHLPK